MAKCHSVFLIGCPWHNYVSINEITSQNACSTRQKLTQYETVKMIETVFNKR